jgi:hypothetical protein
MSLEERHAYAKRIYDIVYLENLISYAQLAIGMWAVAETLANHSQIQQLKQYATLEDIESAVEIFAARYNELQVN